MDDVISPINPNITPAIFLEVLKLVLRVKD